MLIHERVRIMEDYISGKAHTTKVITN